MIVLTLLVGIAAVVALAVAIELSIRQEETSSLHRVPSYEGSAFEIDCVDDAAPSACETEESWAYDVYEPSELLNVDHLRGMDVIDGLLHRLADAVLDARRGLQRRPRRPTSILLHGPQGGAMIILTHVLARRFRAHLVHLFASRALPITNGGSQPIIAAAVHRARNALPSVLAVDELEFVAAAEVTDATRRRAANDLNNEALRPIYGASHLVIGMFATDDEVIVPPRLAANFDHTIHVDAPELEKALVLMALRSAQGGIFRVVPAARLARSAHVARWWNDAA